jgi:hypothetical protein
VLKALPPGTTPEQAARMAALADALPPGTTPEQAALMAALAAALPAGLSPDQVTRMAALAAALPHGTTPEQAARMAALAAALPEEATPEMLAALPHGWLAALQAGSGLPPSDWRAQLERAQAAALAGKAGDHATLLELEAKVGVGPASAAALLLLLLLHTCLKGRKVEGGGKPLMQRLEELKGRRFEDCCRWSTGNLQ